MKYTEFGRTGVMISKLGFGGMRLPMIEDGGKKRVDYDLSTPLMRRAFDLGVNYIDTAPYYCEADSEVAVGKALKGYRDKVYLSTKNPVEDASYDNWMVRLEKSLGKLDTDHIDFYHMWGIGLDAFRTKIDLPNGPIKAALRAKEQGVIRHLSFSFHDKSAENMKPIIDSGYFESVLLQYNLLDRSNEENIAYAQEKGLGVVVMGPVGGGRLGLGSDVIKKMAGREVKSSAEMALRFVMANPGVNVALSGMQTIEMVEENAKVASIETTLSAEEMRAVSQMLEENKKLAELYCTGCNYCMRCEQGINIPYVFSLMNYHKVYGLTQFAKDAYGKLYVDPDKRGNWEKSNGVDASKCIGCGECEGKCPQHIKIIEQLEETHKTLG